MAVLRKEKREHFTAIDNAIFKDYNLSYKAKGLLCQMLSLPDGWNFSIDGLATLSTDGESAVRSALKELQDAGYFRREQVRKDGKIAKIEYVISEIKNCENLVVDFPQQENLKQENPTPYKRLNNKELIKSKTEEIYGDLPENLQEALMEFEQMRKSIKKPINSDRARKMLLNKLHDLAGDDVDMMIRLLDEAILHNWQSVYPLKEEKQGSRKELFARLMRESGDD